VSTDPQDKDSGSEIAIVGMACRFPGASDPDAFWRNLRDGVEARVELTAEELRAAGVPDSISASSAYVRSAFPLGDMPLFDAEFFGMSPKDAAIMDPQHRHFLECCWEALESAGHPPARFSGSIGVYAGCGMNAYMMFNLLTNPELMRSVGLFLVRHTGNDKDFLATRASFELDLRGPSVSVQTACSTSLVAVHTAAQGLLSHECDLALAGGVTIELPHRTGYTYVDGEILSPDGHCRPFDHRSAGTVFGSGAGVVVLRRLADAIVDGDEILAVIRGSAINNDGANKAGYLAPSVEGQAGAVAEALQVSGVRADEISYVEAHGTGTPIGDPIEIAALTEAYRASTQKSNYCGIGSVKANIGHLDTAAGVASLIKVVQGLRHEQMPPSINFEAPNPNCGFEGSPFFVNAALRPWPRAGQARLAGVNSLGVGGTNAHMVVEEAPERALSGPSRAFQLLTLSARNRGALEAASARLAQSLREQPDRPLADVAYTLQLGRADFQVRRSLVCRDGDDAIRLLEGSEPQRVHTRTAPAEAPSVAFMFPGGGAQYPRMALDLYESEPLFREIVDRGLSLYRSRSGVDLRSALFADEAAVEDAASRLTRPSLQLPALFIIEYALAQLWISWGVKPSALIGHSMGENTAACVAGVLAFEDALGLVTLRGQLFERVPRGGMVSVSLPASELAKLLGPGLEIASVNAPELCVATGPEDALAKLEAQLAAAGVEHQRVRIDIAAHSAMLDPILAEFGAYLRGIRLRPPEIPFVSNTTGRWITPAEATDPNYWVRHLRSTVRFGDGIATLLEQPRTLLLEVGPGKALGTLARQSPACGSEAVVLASLRHANQKLSDVDVLLAVLGQIWSTGVAIDWPAFYRSETRQRVLLPTYAFQRQKYWIEPGRLESVAAKAAASDAIEKIENPDDWFFEPVWQRDAEAPARAAPDLSGQSWLVFVDTAGVGARVAARLRAAGARVFSVREGDTYYRISELEFALAPEQGRAGYDALLADLAAAGAKLDRVVHGWTLTRDRSARPGSSFYHHMQERGFFSLTLLAQALGDQPPERGLHVDVITNGAESRGSEATEYPEKATLAGPLKVIPQEFPGITTASLDVELPSNGRGWRRKAPEASLDALAARVFDELARPPQSGRTLLRAGERWRGSFARRGPQPRVASRLRDGGVYLITGGLGGIGLVVAEHLARTRGAKLALIARSALPAREDWARVLAQSAPADKTAQRLRSLERLERLGAELLPLAADVANVEQMQEAVARTRARFGRLDGVFHAAGVLDDGLIQTKNQTGIEEVFAPKIQGVLVLEQVLAGAGTDFVVLFSSTSSVLGAAGQVDYAAANAFLNAFAHSRRGSKAPQWIAVNWGVWSDVGMGAEAARRAHPEPDSAAPSASTNAHPLLGSAAAGGKGERTYRAALATSTHWILDEHRTRSGAALIPGTGYIELARAAWAELEPEAPLALRDVFFLAPLAVADGSARSIRTSLAADGALEVASVAGSSSEVHAVARVGRGEFAAPPALDLAAIRTRCSARRTARDERGICTPQERAHLAFGSRWRCLNEIWWGDGEALAALSLPAGYEAELETFPLHPALLDIATGYGLELVPGYDASSVLFVPFSYREVRVHAALAPRIFSWIRSAPDNHADKEIARFDVTLTDASGRVLVEIADFAVKRTAPGRPFAEARKAAPEPALDAHLSPAERAFRRTLRAGIGASEGVAALERILAEPWTPQVIVSSIELDTLIAQVHAAAPAPATDGARFERPALASEYVAPRDPLESALAEIWQELLGIEKVGVQDDFFAVGGHSLIAVRLFAQVKKRLGVDRPISILYEAPTIERFAALVRGEIEGAETSAASAQASFRFLVPMHTQANTKETPIFLVAGMFGNVLNLRHLADLLGKDRPFYALQARGLYGGDEPHESFTEMAADYLAEVRRVQPTGPYLFAGYSGGGICAFEMAQQVTAAGERVDALILLDTPIARPFDRLSRLDKVRIHLQRFARGGLRYPLQWLEERARWREQQRRAREEAASQAFEFRSRKIGAAFYRALAGYETQAYAGPVFLFRPPLQIAYRLGAGRNLNYDRDFIAPDNAWGRYLTGAFEVTEVPGDHDSMVLEPSVRVLAAKIRAALASGV